MIKWLKNLFTFKYNLGKVHDSHLLDTSPRKILPLNYNNWYKITESSDQAIKEYVDNQLPVTSIQLTESEVIQKYLDSVHEFYSKPKTIKIIGNNNEQIKARETGRVSKRTNSTSKKRIKKSKSNNKKPRKRTGI